MHGFDPQLLLSAEIGLSKVAYWLVKSDGARAFTWAPERGPSGRIGEGDFGTPGLSTLNGPFSELPASYDQRFDTDSDLVLWCA